MTKENNSSDKRPEGKILNFDHLVFRVSNAKTVSDYRIFL